MMGSKMRWFTIGYLSAMGVGFLVNVGFLVYERLTADAEAYSLENDHPTRDPLGIFPREDSDPLNKGEDNDAERGETANPAGDPRRWGY